MAAGDFGCQLLAVAAFAVGWTLMVMAMMLPSAAALSAAFGRATNRRHDRGGLRILVACRFLGIWLGVGCTFQLSTAASTSPSSRSRPSTRIASWPALPWCWPAASSSLVSNAAA
jgi:predicted metal-binding membrane protein